MLKLWCNECGANIEVKRIKMTSNGVESGFYYQLEHSTNYTFESKCEFSKIKIGVDLEND